MSIMIVMEKEKRLKWLNFKTWLLSLLFLLLRFQKPIKYFSLLLIPIIIIIIEIMIILIITNNLLCYLFDFVWNFIIIWHLLLII